MSGPPGEVSGEVSLGIEDQILSNIGDLPDEPTVVEPGSPTTPETPPVTPTTPHIEPAISSPVAPGGGPVKGTQPQPQGQPEDPSVAISNDPNPQGVKKQDAAGNLVNENGTVVANAGRERRYYERSEKLAITVQQAKNQITALNAQLQNAQQNANSAEPLSQHLQTHGVTSQELPVALQFFAGFKTDPVGTIKRILTEAEAKGHNVRQALELPGNNVDMSAIKALIDQSIAPLRQTQTAAVDQTQRQTDATTQYNQFVAQNPDVVIHEAEVAHVMQQNPSWSLEKAYFETKLWFSQNGFNFNLPLRPQMEARNAQQPNNQANLNPGVKPLVNGGNAPVTDTPQIASHNDSWDNVVDEAMKENGMERRRFS